MEYGSAAEHRRARRGGCGDVAARRRGKHAARVDRIDGDVGAVGGVGRGRQFGAILFPGLGDAAGEFDERFAARDRRQHIGDALDGDELLVGVENVEFGLIGRVGGLGILLDVVLAILRGGVLIVGELRGGAGHDLVDGFLEDGAIVGEIREHGELRAEDDDGDEIGGRHLLREEFHCRVVGANDVVGFHRA